MAQQQMRATKNSKGNWSYRGVTIWRSDFTNERNAKGEWLDGYSPRFVRWELTDEATNYSIEGCFDTLREAKQFVDQQQDKEGDQ